MFFGPFEFSQKRKREFMDYLKRLIIFCQENNIITDYDISYPTVFAFVIDGIPYMTSNRARNTVSPPYDFREKYAENIEKHGITKFYASTTRVITIYNDLCEGKKLDARGRVISPTPTESQ